MVENFPSDNYFKIRFYFPFTVQRGKNVCQEGTDEWSDLTFDTSILGVITMRGQSGLLLVLRGLE